jgi:hypothetical protein
VFQIPWRRSPSVAATLAKIEAQLSSITQLITKGNSDIMDLTQLQQAEAAETTAIQALIEDLQGQVRLLASASGSGDMAGVNAVVAQMTANLKAANDALAANPLPAAPPPADTTSPVDTDTGADTDTGSGSDTISGSGDDSISS